MTEKNKFIKKTLRITKEDAAMLSQAAKDHGMNESEYLRVIIRNRPSGYPDIKEKIKELVNSVNRVGININQIARNVNMGVNDSRQIEHLMDELGKMTDIFVKAVDNIGDK